MFYPPALAAVKKAEFSRGTLIVKMIGILSVLFTAFTFNGMAQAVAVSPVTTTNTTNPQLAPPVSVWDGRRPTVEDAGATPPQ